MVQLVARLTLDQEVLGSIPSGPVNTQQAPSVRLSVPFGCRKVRDLNLWSSGTAPDSPVSEDAFTASLKRHNTRPVTAFISPGDRLSSRSYQGRAPRSVEPCEGRFAHPKGRGTGVKGGEGTAAGGERAVAGTRGTSAEERAKVIEVWLNRMGRELEWIRQASMFMPAGRRKRPGLRIALGPRTT